MRNYARYFAVLVHLPPPNEDNRFIVFTIDEAGMEEAVQDALDEGLIVAGRGPFYVEMNRANVFRLLNTGAQVFLWTEFGPESPNQSTAFLTVESPRKTWSHGH